MIHLRQITSRHTEDLDRFHAMAKGFKGYDHNEGLVCMMTVRSLIAYFSSSPDGTRTLLRIIPKKFSTAEKHRK